LLSAAAVPGNPTNTVKVVSGTSSRFIVRPCREAVRLWLDARFAVNDDLPFVAFVPGRPDQEALGGSIVGSK